MHALLSVFAFIAHRLVQALLVMLAILVIAFAVRESLGDPIREFTGQVVSEAERAELRKELGLDRPWYVQFTDYLRRATRGDLGTSFIYKKPTVEVVLAKFPASFELVLGASLIVLLFCVPAGVYCAVRPNRLGARLVLGLSVLGIS
ncbi:MAG: ABC transporter permease, partial [Pseudomonadota bacterium]